MNDNEADRIAAMAHALRPDWPIASVRSLLARPELANRTRRDVAVALAWVACETQTKTPARVLEAGPWWIATNADGHRTGRTSYNVPCPDHAGEILPCGRCAAVAVTAPLARHHLSQARAELAAARAKCCSHGVERGRCREDHPTEGVGTGAGEGATGQDTGTAWVTRSTDYPEAPAQAHPLTNEDHPTEIEAEETTDD